jgi:hypothetical protein
MRPGGQPARVTLRLGPVKVTVVADPISPNSVAQAAHPRRRKGNGQFASGFAPGDVRHAFSARERL